MDVGQIGGKNLVYIVELHVKLRPKRINIVEMRAKSVSWVKIRRFTPIFLPPGFLTKKHAKMGTFLNIFFSLFSTKKTPQLVNSRKKPFPSNSAHKWGHSQCSEWNRKEESPLHFNNGKCILGLSCHMCVSVRRKFIHMIENRKQVEESTWGLRYN